MAEEKQQTKKKGKVYKMSNVYEIEGNSIKTKNKKCPKCKVFMANHKDRWSCGKCGYGEMK